MLYSSPDPVPVSADRQPVAQELIGHIELVVLGVLADAFKVLQLDAQDHILGFGQQVDVVVTCPELTSAGTERNQPFATRKITSSSQYVILSALSVPPKTMSLGKSRCPIFI